MFIESVCYYNFTNVFIQNIWLKLAIWCNRIFLRKKKEFCILLTFSFLKHFQDLIILTAVPGL